MVEAKGCAILAGGPGFGTCTETHDQSGLLAGYVDETTPIHSYLGTGPLHTLLFAGNEWFSDSGTTSAAVSYRVAAVRAIGIDHFILWNEDASGIGVFELWYGLFPGDLMDLVIAGGVPTDHPVVDYPHDLWEFPMRPRTGWWTLIAGGCPQPIGTGFPACGFGEVAFGGPVPEPGTWALMLAGFGLVGIAARRRRLAIAVA
jgi:hypothetical protein